MKSGKLLLYFSLLALVSCKQSAEVKVLFNDSNLSYDGRIRYTNDAAILSWPGSAVSINFSGREIKAEFSESDTANYYNVILDGHIISTMHFDKERKTYVLASGLTNTKHSLQLFKRTEWDKGSTSLYSFSGNSLFILPASPKPVRKIEFYGKSVVDMQLKIVLQIQVMAILKITITHFLRLLQGITMLSTGVLQKAASVLLLVGSHF
jgi:hypothetical protein